MIEKPSNLKFWEQYVSTLIYTYCYTILETREKDARLFLWKEQNKCQIVQISCMGIQIALDRVSIQGQNN